MQTNKILLFIVEGPSDEQSLAPALEKIILQKNVKFKVIHGDITSDSNSNINNIEKRISNNCVKKFINENSQYNLSDIYGIVHIVDLDGAFIPDDNIEEDPSIIKPKYMPDKILCKNKAKFLATHNNKQSILRHLSTIDKILNIPYSIFYMSCNLDHVLHNKPNSTDFEKKINSIIFGDNYDDPLKFEDFFNCKKIKIEGTYEESWKYITINLNSLKRGSNFWICINSFKV